MTEETDTVARLLDELDHAIENMKDGGSAVYLNISDALKALSKKAQARAFVHARVRVLRYWDGVVALRQKDPVISEFEAGRKAEKAARKLSVTVGPASV